MNTPVSILHWFKKDLRENRWYIFLFCALLLGNASLGIWLETKSLVTEVWLLFGFLTQVGAWLIGSLISFRIFWQENPFDENLFWPTRPVKGIVLLIEKGILSLALLSFVAIENLMVYIYVPKLKIREACCIMPDIRFLLLAIGLWSVAIVLSLFISRRKARIDMSYFVTLLFAFTLIPFMIAFILQAKVVPESHKEVFTYALAAFCTIGSWAALAHQYWTKITYRSWIILAVAWSAPLGFCMLATIEAFAREH